MAPPEPDLTPWRGFVTLDLDRPTRNSEQIGVAVVLADPAAALPSGEVGDDGGDVAFACLAFAADRERKLVSIPPS